MSRRYAEGTSIAPEKSLAEIKKLVTANSGTNWRYLEDRHFVKLGFELGGIDIRITHTMPKPDAREFHTTQHYRSRSRAQAQAAYEAELRRQWRVLLLRLKVRFEMMRETSESAAQAFGSYAVGPTGETVEEVILPQLIEQRKLLTGGG